MSIQSRLKRLRRAYKTVSAFGIRRSYRYARFVAANALSGKRHDNPPVAKPEVLLISLPLSSPTQPPLGLASIKSYLQRGGILVYCMDLNNRLHSMLKGHKEYRYGNLHNVFLDEGQLKKFHDSLYNKIIKGWAEEMLALEPKFIGISVNSQVTFSSLSQMAKLIRRSAPAIKIILGGPCCKSEGKAMIDKRYGDVIVKGEGEKSFFDVVSAYKHNRSLEGIPGIIYMDNNEVIDTGEPALIADLDSLPFPDFDDFPIRSYQPAVLDFFPKLPIMGSRGCPAHCDFCNINFLWGKFRQRSAKSIFAEMKRNRERYGVCDFTFNDSLINVNPRVLEELCELIAANREIFRWNGNYRIWQRPMSGAFFEKMAEAGCSSLSIGVESGSEKVRKSMHKPFSNGTLKEELKNMYEAGIHTHLMFIVGYPTETAEDYNETINIVNETKQHIGSVSFGNTCMIVPGTPLWGKKDFYGIMYDEKGDWHVGDNTMEERLRRLDSANKIASKLGLANHHSLLKTDKIKLS